MSASSSPRPLPIATLKVSLFFFVTMSSWIATAITPTDVCGQVVQLPSIRNFSYRGSVMVPDQGTTSLGGNRTYASGSRGGRGPGLSGGRQMTTSNASASATIIDLEAMDREILGMDPRRLKARPARPNFNQTVDANRLLNESKSLVRNARIALAQGKPSTAKAAYQLAISKLEQLSRSSIVTFRSAKERSQDPAYLLAYARAEFASQFPALSGRHNPTTAPQAPAFQRHRAAPRHGQALPTQVTPTIADTRVQR